MSETTFLGQKLNIVTEPVVFDKPKEMLAWNHNNHPTKRTIVAILLNGTAIDIDHNWIEHCAEIPEAFKPRTIPTNKELAEWCANGKGQVHYVGAANVHTFYSYQNEDDDSIVTKDIRVRKFGDKEWVEPTLEYLEIKIKSFLDTSVSEDIVIGNQVWMSKNLDLTDEGLGKDHWKNPDNGEVYYTWDAAKRLANKVPGFHLPTINEWDELAEARGGVCRNTEERNEHKYYKYEKCEKLKQLLRIKLAGYYGSGSFGNVETIGYFWSASELGSNAYSKHFDTGASMSAYTVGKTNGCSVRLVKDSV